MKNKLKLTSLHEISKKEKSKILGGELPGGDCVFVCHDCNLSTNPDDAYHRSRNAQRDNSTNPPPGF